MSAGLCIGLCIGLAHCGWGSDTTSTSTATKIQARAGRAGGRAPIGSLLPQQANEPISPDGRALGATPRAKNALVGESRSGELDRHSQQGGHREHLIDPQGREIEEVEALADLRQELAEDIREERRLEKERIAAAQLALGNHDQDAERAALLEAAGLELDAMGEIPGIEEGDGFDEEAELSSDLSSLDTDAEGRDIEEVEALAGPAAGNCCRHRSRAQRRRRAGFRL